jgi:hypothetical protein
MLYHGTSLGRAKRIINEGFRSGVHLNWNVSKKEVCFYSDDREAQAGKTPENAAYWNGIPALLADNDSRIVVFVCDAHTLKRDMSCGRYGSDSAVVMKKLHKNAIVAAWISPDLSDHYDILEPEIAGNRLSTLEIGESSYRNLVFDQEDYPLTKISIADVKRFMN